MAEVEDVISDMEYQSSTVKSEGKWIYWLFKFNLHGIFLALFSWAMQVKILGITFSTNTIVHVNTKKINVMNM